LCFAGAPLLPLRMRQINWQAAGPGIAFVGMSAFVRFDIRAYSQSDQKVNQNDQNDQF